MAPFTIDGEWVSSSVAKERPVKVKISKRLQKGHVCTLISINGNLDKNKLFKELKSLCHCGGRLQDNQMILQGDHREKVEAKLKQQGLL